MSSETFGQSVIFTCDNCDEEYEAAGDFRDVWEAARDDGWRCFKNSEDEWEHRCPDCRGA